MKRKSFSPPRFNLLCNYSTLVALLRFPQDFRTNALVVIFFLCFSPIGVHTADRRPLREAPLGYDVDAQRRRDAHPSHVPRPARRRLQHMRLDDCENKMCSSERENIVLFFWTCDFWPILVFYRSGAAFPCVFTFFWRPLSRSFRRP